MSFLSFLGLRNPYIGVDVGSSSIKVIHLTHSHKEVRLLYASLTELDRNQKESNHHDIGMTINEIIKEAGLKKKKIAMNNIEKSPIIRYLTFPKMPRDELKEAVKWEAKKLVSLPIEDMIFDFLIIGEKEESGVKKFEVILVITERQGIINQMKTLKRYGLKLEVIDVSSLAIINSLKLSHKNDMEDNLAFVDIGAGKTEINIVKNQGLRFTRSVQTGGDEITQAIQNHLGIEHNEAELLKRRNGLESTGINQINDVIKGKLNRFILETQRSIDYYNAQFREGAISKIILMGGTPLMPGFIEYFSSYFDGTVEFHDPFSGIVCDDSSIDGLREMASRFSVSVGLALRMKN